MIFFFSTRYQRVTPDEAFLPFIRLHAVPAAQSIILEYRDSCTARNQRYEGENGEWTISQ